MKITIIGSGNVATVLGLKMREAGHRILQLYSRNQQTGETLATRLNTTYVSAKKNIENTADVYLIAVHDDALPAVIKDLHFPGKTVVHTAASVNKNLLGSVSNQFGVFYPLQTLHKDKKTVAEIPIFIDGNTAEVRSQLTALATSLDCGKVEQANDEQRLKLHVAAVVVNNFVHHLLSLTAAYCQKEDIDFKLLQPLLQETVHRIQSGNPQLLQTGPAIRHDEISIRRHLEILQKHPALRNLYILLTESIQQFADSIKKDN